MPGSTSLFNYVQNIPKVRTNGVELAFDRRDLVGGFDVSGSVTLADPEVIEDPAFPAAEGKTLPQVPRRRATLVLSYRPDDRTTLTLAGRYASRSFGTIDKATSSATPSRASKAMWCGRPSPFPPHPPLAGRARS